MDQNLLNGQDDSSEVEAPLSSPPQVADKGAEEVMGTQASIAIQVVREYRVFNAELHKPQCAEVCRGCCNWRCGGRFVIALLFCVVCAIITMLFARGNLLVAWLLAAGVPFFAFSVYASEIFGGTSVDKGLTFLVIVLVFVLRFLFMILMVIIRYVQNPIMREIAKIDQGALCRQKGVMQFLTFLHSEFARALPRIHVSYSSITTPLNASVFHCKVNDLAFDSITLGSFGTLGFSGQ